MFDTLEITAEAADPIRRLQRRDAGRIAGFVAALDQDTLHLRFGRFMPESAIQAHYARLDWDSAVLLAWEIAPASMPDGAPESAPVIGGVVEVYPYPTPAAASPGRTEAEIALVVAQNWRGRGIGRLLLGSAMAAAAQTGAVRSTMLLSARDHALARMARRLGFKIDAPGDQAVFQHHDDSSAP